MTHILRCKVLPALFLFASIGAARAQTPTGGIQGTVTDPSGALIPSAQIVISNSTGFSKSVTSRSDGTFALDHLVPGRYAAAITATGFAPAAVANIPVYSGKTTPENLTLQLPVEQQQVQVNDQGLSVDTSPDNNASAIVIKGKDLDALSDDPDEMQNELTALAGPAAGPNGGEIYIDGFTGGQLPQVFDSRDSYQSESLFRAV